MRIGQITYTYKPIIGGGDVYVQLLENLLSKERHLVRTFQKDTKIVDKSLVMVPNPLARLGRAEFWTQALFLFLVKNELRQEDLLICHYPNYLLRTLRLQKDNQPPVLGISHGVTWDDAPNSLRSRIKLRVAKAAFEAADGFVANDTFFLREMGLDIAPRQAMFQEVAKGRWFIPNCIPPGFVGGKTRKELADLHAIILPRNIFRNRGVHLAIEAFSDFAKQYRQTKLLILGKESQPKYAGKLKGRVQELGLEEKIIFWGHVPHEEMLDFYTSAEMCLVPSICGEGTSLSALEAMACGVATISTSVAGLKDLPTIQCEANTKALAKAMLQVYPERKRIGDEQKATVHTDYSYARWAEAWIAVIDKVTASTG